MSIKKNSSNYWNERFDQYGHTGLNNRIAYLFDQKNRFKNIKNVLKKVHPVPSKVLDLGCGTGDFSRLAEKVFPNSQITGIDISSSCIDSNLPSEKITYLNCTIEELHEKNICWDLIISVTYLQHISDKASTVDMIFDLLEPGGTFVLLECVDPNIQNDYMSGLSEHDLNYLQNSGKFVLTNATSHNHLFVQILELISKKRSTEASTNTSLVTKKRLKSYYFKQVIFIFIGLVCEVLGAVNFFKPSYRTFVYTKPL